jgi:hypothetical protein
MHRTGLLLAIALFGCNEHGKGGIDGDPCGGLGCASGPGTLTLTVLDQFSKQPVSGMIEFSDANGKLPFVCSVVVDATMPCPSWKFSQIGGFDVTVRAPGYSDGMIHVLVQGPAGCCGLGPDTSDSMDLHPLVP